ncbi:MAG: hypothetical protein ABIS86_22695 [Streptosporangiaceae bacterium]
MGKTGTFAGDVRALLGWCPARCATPIVPDLLAEGARGPEIALTLETALREARRGVIATASGLPLDLLG